MSKTVLLRGVTNGLSGRVEDVLLAAGRVAAVGDLDPADASDVIGLEDVLALPGLRDAHVHVGQWATFRQRLDLRAATSAEDVAAAVGRAAAQPGRGVIVGYGFRDGLWTDFPHKALLDRAAPGRQVLLLSNDLHMSWLSSPALQMLGRPEHPTGVLLEHESAQAAARFGAVSPEVLDGWVLEALARAAARGVTRIVDFEIGDGISDWTRRWQRHGRLDVAVACAVYPEHLENVVEQGHRTGKPVPGCDGAVSVGPYKLFLDGSLNTRTALCHHPYPDGGQMAQFGLELLAPEQLQEQMRAACAVGLRPAVHAIGDRACSQAIDAFEALGCPGRIEHAQLVLARDVARLAQLPVVVGAQPAHCPDDRDVAEVAWPSRTGRAFAYADLLRAGVTLEFGSDAPVAPLDPWDGIASAISRTDDDRPPWHPEQAIPLRAAIRASCGGVESLCPGDRADLVLVPVDVLRRDGAELREVDVIATMSGGRWTHRTT